MVIGTMWDSHGLVLLASGSYLLMVFFGRPEMVSKEGKYHQVVR
jgi:hypothetical protein